MSELVGGPWWVVAAASLPSALSGCWVIWRWFLERSDRQADVAMSREERVAREMEASRLALAREHAALADRLREELVRYQCRLHLVELDRERGWDLARHWHRRCHELRHAGRNAQAIVAGFCEREQVDVPIWPDMSVVGLEDPST